MHIMAVVLESQRSLERSLEKVTGTDPLEQATNRAKRLGSYIYVYIYISQ